MKTIPKLNELIVYRKRREPALGIFVSQGGLKLTLLSEDGKHQPLELKKLVYCSGIIISPKLTDHEKKLELRGLRKSLESRKSELDIEKLWKQIAERGEVEFDELLSLYKSENDPSREDMLLFFWAIDKNRIYFERAGDNKYLVNTSEVVNEKIESARRRKIKEEKRANALEWIKSVLNEKEPAAINNEYSDFIELMAHYSFDLDNYERAKEAKSFIQDAGFSDIESVVQFLKKIGFWDEDDDHVSRKFYQFEKYSKRALQELEDLIPFDPDLSGYTDKTALEVYSVDDISTKDIDDAISFEENRDSYELGIHISDVSSVIRRDHFLDTEAQNRGETVYFVEKTINMFPEDLVNEKLSLVSGRDRPALSLFVSFDKNELSIMNYRFEKTVVRVRENLTYEKAFYLFDDGRWNPLISLTEKLREKRLENGALIVQLPELKIEIDDEGNIVPRKNLMTSLPHKVVSECMVLMNSLAADFFSKNNIPAIYRSQTQEIDREAFNLDTDDPLYPTKIVKFLKPSRVVLTPEPHKSLGIDSYVQITSPIRRYLDLVLQRQLTSFLADKVIPYSGEELENLNSKVSMNVREIKNAQRSRHRYWFLKYLIQQDVKILKGYVSHLNKYRTTAYIPEYFVEFPISNKNSEELSSGDLVDLEIKSIDPLRRKIKLNHL